jgi:hypothetical protein
MPEFPRKDFQLHVGWRTIKTAVSAMLVAIGVIVALLVNYFLPPCPGRGLLGGIQRSVPKEQQGLSVPALRSGGALFFCPPP